MKVLILHQHFNTPEKGGPLRSYYLAKALTEHGIDVSIITARQQSLYTIESIEGIDVHYLPIAYDNRFGFYKRGVSFLRYAIGCVSIAGTIKDISLCYAISVPITVGQAALWIKKKYGIPFIFEVGDLWPDAPVQMGFIKNPFLVRALYWLEKKIYASAKSIVALSPMIKQAIEKKAPAKTIDCIPNMADTEFFYPLQKNPAVMTKYETQGKFVISYIGAVGFANGLDYYLECARAAQKSKLPVQFIICGDGASVDSLKKASADLRIENLLFLEFRNREGVRQILNISDATFISYRPFPILETGSPNKYFDGLAAGKLIVVNFKGWIKDEIENEKCGIALDPKFPHDFVAKIKPFLEDRTLLEEYGNNSRRLAERKYARKNLGDQYVRIIKNSL